MRCAIISDVHGNLPALDAVLTQVGEVDQLWCLGDLVGYGPQPNECITRLRERAALCVAGNHDWAAIGKMDTNDFNPDASKAAEWTKEELTAENREFLEGLPEQLNVGEQSEFTLVHGSPREPIWEYLTHVSMARLNFDYFQTPYCLVGHTHVPLIFQRPQPEDASVTYRTIVPQPGRTVKLGSHRLIVNPGSVGQPRDGNAAGAYMVYETHKGAAATLTLQRAEYAVGVVQEKMRAAGLPPRLVTRLTYGW